MGAIPLTAYHWVNDEIVAVLPREWKMVAAKVNGIVQELHEQRPHLSPISDHAGYATYQASAVKALPPGVFVWLDEFSATCQNHCERDHLGSDPLTLNPVTTYDEVTRAIVREGFEGSHCCESDAGMAGYDDEKTMDAYMELGYWSAVARSFGAANWDYWISLPSWTPREGACLLTELDPNEYDSTASKNSLQTVRLVRRITDIERRADREQKAGLLRDNPSPKDWAEWAYANGYALPRSLQACCTPSSMDDAETNDAQKAGAGGTAAKEPLQDKSEPSMKCGTNLRAACVAWAAWMAKNNVQDGDTRKILAERIVSIAAERRYLMEGGALFSIHLVTSAIPEGTTGTRAKNGQKKRKS